MENLAADTPRTDRVSGFSLSRLIPGRRVGVSALFLLTFAIVSSCISLFIRATGPEPDIDMLSRKMRTVAENAEAYDTIFLGTSRTLYHVIPDEVEEAAAAQGCTGLGVFNLGVYAMTGVEQDWVLRRLLDTRSSNLKRIVLEPPLPEYRHLREITTDRSRFFHGPENHADAVRSISSFGESLPKRAFRAGMYVLGTAYDLSGVGLASAKFFPPAKTTAYPPMSMAEDGFEALDEVTSDDIEARHQEFLDDQAKARAQLELYGRPSPNMGARAAYMIDKMRRIEAAGVEPVLFISPDLMELDRTPQTGEAVSRKAPGLPVINFNRPDAYPGLFELGLWHDFSHFNREGATRLSRAVGAELCRAIQSQSEADGEYAIR